ncbi:Protein prickle-like protein [Dinothrombium tinctorium]|uniref:Protein prickle-like protein n=1 Tax=Dinothrombium tinctorium TaxID=1965070 RepID=A0A443QZC6_9ACAR|nr:Protein prickle-like protein [Dinothrombium tinctorium]
MSSSLSCSNSWFAAFNRSAYSVTSTTVTTVSKRCTTTSSTTAAATMKEREQQQQHHHWWKVCWIYSNAAFFEKQQNSLSQTVHSILDSSANHDRCAVIDRNHQHEIEKYLSEKIKEQRFIEMCGEENGDEDEEWRRKQMAKLNPKQDLRILVQEKYEKDKLFILNQLKKAKTDAILVQNLKHSEEEEEESKKKCAKCSNAIDDEFYVQLAVANDQRKFHFQCFKCCVCQLILCDFKVYLKHSENLNDDNLMCQRHFVELFKPRCYTCDELIFDEECTEAESQVYHIHHFNCYECKRPLGGQQYVMKRPANETNEKAFCLNCFDCLFGELCEECGQLINCSIGSIKYEGRAWHAQQQCFHCFTCSQSLLGKPFLPASDGHIYCSTACHSQAEQQRVQQLQQQKTANCKEKEKESPMTAINSLNSENQTKFITKKVTFDLNNETITKSNSSNSTQATQYDHRDEDKMRRKSRRKKRRRKEKRLRRLRRMRRKCEHFNADICSICSSSSHSSSSSFSSASSSSLSLYSSTSSIASFSSCSSHSSSCSSYCSPSIVDELMLKSNESLTKKKQNQITLNNNNGHCSTAGGRSSSRVRYIRSNSATQSCVLM